jgi:hypothetical protein
VTFTGMGIVQLHGWRNGVCHRCGWRGRVGEVRRRDRKVLMCSREFGRLCHECTGDLLQLQSPRRGIYGFRRVILKAERTRQVA